MNYTRDAVATRRPLHLGGGAGFGSLDIAAAASAASVGQSDVTKE